MAELWEYDSFEKSPRIVLLSRDGAEYNHQARFQKFSGVVILGQNIITSKDFKSFLFKIVVIAFLLVF